MSVPGVRLVPASTLGPQLHVRKANRTLAGTSLDLFPRLCAAGLPPVVPPRRLMSAVTQPATGQGMWTANELPEGGNAFSLWELGNNRAVAFMAEFFDLVKPLVELRGDAWRLWPREDAMVAVIDRVTGWNTLALLAPGPTPSQGEWPLPPCMVVDFHRLSALGIDGVHLSPDGYRDADREGHKLARQWDYSCTVWMRWAFHEPEMVDPRSITCTMRATVAGHDAMIVYSPTWPFRIRWPAQRTLDARVRALFDAMIVDAGGIALDALHDDAALALAEDIFADTRRRYLVLKGVETNAAPN